MKRNWKRTRNNTTKRQRCETTRILVNANESSRYRHLHPTIRMNWFDRSFTVALVLIMWISCINCYFLVEPQSTVYGCINKAIKLTWTIQSFSSTALVRWNHNSTTIMRQVGPTMTPAPQGAYIGRVENGSNSDLIIKTPIVADTGVYQCSAVYNNGTPASSNVVSLFVYDNWTVTLMITEKQDGESAILKSNVDDPSVQQTWSTGAQGSSITVTEDGVYSLCISGGRAECLDPSSKNCTSYSLKIKDCGSFHCGFWLLMLVVVSSIIICILIWQKVEIFEGFSTVKIVIIIIFSGVAIGIGSGLGLGLREGQENCLICGATIGIGISLGVALSVIQFIVVIKCNKEKGCDGNSKGETSDRSNGDRARTPASATGINLETKKKSQNKPTEKGTEASSLTAKTFGQPLPDTPNARKHQLEPLKTDSFEVENSTTEKKKKKKRKKKKETSEGNEASEEKEERPELEF